MAGGSESDWLASALPANERVGISRCSCSPWQIRFYLYKIKVGATVTCWSAKRDFAKSLLILLKISMNKHCRLAMHLPGARRVIHRGRSYTRCADCDATLIDTTTGWRPVPIGKRVTWLPRRPADDPFFAVVLNSDRRRLRLRARQLLRMLTFSLRRGRTGRCRS